MRILPAKSRYCLTNGKRFDFIRADIDDKSKTGLHLLTGSAKPNDKSKRHTGTGRIAKVTMYPMSLWVSKNPSGERWI
jgi:hypothetical protein